MAFKLSPPLTFRFSGVMDWERLYRGGRQYFVDALGGDPEFTERKYKTKVDEIEGIWVFGQNMDAYHRLEFEIEFKVIDVKQVVVEGKAMIEGKARWWITAEIKDDYEDKTAAGKREIFPLTKAGKESWLHKAYKRVVRRDIEEVAEAWPVQIADGYIAFLKETCGSIAKE